jgi:hypothetical protein
MFSRCFRLTIAVLLLAPTLLFAGDKKNAPEQQSLVKFVVLKDDNGKPVRSAAVILHPVGKNGKQTKGGYEVKTDSDGKTEFDGVPYGELRVQVIAEGFQTFGDDFNIQQPLQEIAIRLKRPKDQYTIYGDGKKEVPPTALPPQ